MPDRTHFDLTIAFPARSAEADRYPNSTLASIESLSLFTSYVHILQKTYSRRITYVDQFPIDDEIRHDMVKGYYVTSYIMNTLCTSTNTLYGVTLVSTFPAFRL